MNIVLKLAPVGQENLINSRKAFGKNNGYVLKFLTMIILPSVSTTLAEHILELNIQVRIWCSLLR